MGSFEWENKDGVFGNYVEKDEHDEIPDDDEGEVSISSKDELNGKYIKLIESRLGQGWVRELYEALL